MKDVEPGAPLAKSGLLSRKGYQEVSNHSQTRRSSDGSFSRRYRLRT